MAIIICLVVCVIETLVLFFYLRWENRRRDREMAAVPAEAHDKDVSPGSPGELVDITDLKNRQFRYVY